MFICVHGSSYVFMGVHMCSWVYYTFHFEICVEQFILQIVDAVKSMPSDHVY